VGLAAAAGALVGAGGAPAEQAAKPMLLTVATDHKRNSRRRRCDIC
jgi:hypothetical protein